MIDILLVEDDKELSQLLCDFLRNEGYIVSTVDNGSDAVKLFKKYGAKIVVLDIMIKGADGFTVCNKIREISDIPIIILSAVTEKQNVLKGINMGADDYIEKPFDIDILLAKIKGIFKRRYLTDEIICDDIKIDKVNKTVYKNETKIDMTIKEYELLLLLVENKGKPLNKDIIFNKIWGYDSYSQSQTLTVHIKWLREKIEDDVKNPIHIKTIWGMGYKFE